MSLKTRLAKLEAAQALKAKPVEEYDPEVLEMEMTALIRSINDGSYRLTGLYAGTFGIAGTGNETGIGKVGVRKWIAVSLVFTGRSAEGTKH